MGKEKEHKEKESFYVKYWYINGLGWGVMMFLVMELLLPYHKDGIDTENLFLILLGWMGGGLLFGLFNRFIHTYSEKKTKT